MNDFAIQLLPLLVIWLVLAVPLYKLAKRKSVSTQGIILGLVLSLVPLGIMVVAVWWASLPDKALLDRISQLEKLNASRGASVTVA